MKLNERLMINCDMGESFGAWKMGNDEEVMPWIDMANIACGFHASDPSVMSTTIQLATRHGVKIGAHPGYPDLQGFGRRTVALKNDEISQIMVYQIGAIKALCHYHNAELHYVKPHGALYNDMMKDPSVFKAVVSACESFSLPLMILATKQNEKYLELADEYNVPLLFEAFADRTYQDNGLLTPRSHYKAVLKNSEDIFYQVMQLAEYGSVTSVTGQKIPIEADTVCIHGDNSLSIAVVRRLYESLEGL
ncbi:5-oxoprolinase subunit PxpA [Vibrio hannami]|uniref:5-oxoprolinase subunit PxpA n=1 Tax=Vibrio hannami TaxID=2717094 RepID=UPI00240F69B0|nr:5-oxoprolinase subunit PxpA [Vibrio hannami]MDG3085457.1 5-oxoprolinase subunit PxpA [Vibrio hannami]